jgi:molecular chaperone GrpE
MTDWDDFRRAQGTEPWRPGDQPGAGEPGWSGASAGTPGGVGDGPAGPEQGAGAGGRAPDDAGGGSPGARPEEGAVAASVAPESHPGPAAGSDATGPGATELEETERQRDEYLEALKRLQADFENYKKRMVKQQTEHLERAAEALVTNLLPALDALDLAVAHAESHEDPGSESLVQVASTFFDVLGKEGLERIYPQGEPFDPTVHDAVLHEAAAEGEDERVPEVTEVLRPGYRWKRRVLRPAMVKVKG